MPRHATRCSGSRATARSCFVTLAIAALVVGAACVLYRGPGRAIVRGHVGDAGATMLVYALVGLAVPRLTAAMRGAIVMTLAATIELGQLVWHASSTLGEYTVGATFDGWDFVAYIAGTLVAIAWERHAIRRRA